MTQADVFSEGILIDSKDEFWKETGAMHLGHSPRYVVRVILRLDYFSSGVEFESVHL